jgi:hypothetical protein
VDVADGDTVVGTAAGTAPPSCITAGDITAIRLGTAVTITAATTIVTATTITTITPVITTTTITVAAILITRI